MASLASRFFDERPDELPVLRRFFLLAGGGGGTVLLSELLDALLDNTVDIRLVKADGASSSSL